MIFQISACNQDEENDLNLVTINLLTSDNPTFFEKTVILFDDNDYLIKTNFDTFINNYPFDIIYGYDDIKTQAIQDSNNQDVLLMTDYLKLPKYGTFILAHHLEMGSCLIFDKKNNKIISTIEMEVYMEGEPMMSTSGRRFYINEDLFLETVDMIS